MSADTYGKDNKPKITNMGAQWPTLGPIPTSSFHSSLQLHVLTKVIEHHLI
jgi:hypothetical protein